MPETRRLVNRPLKFEHLWFEASGQPSAQERGDAAGGQQVEEGHPSAHPLALLWTRR